MFLDASALVAILNREDDADVYAQRLDHHYGTIYYSDIVLFESTQAIARALASRAGASLRNRPDLIDEAWRSVFEFLQLLGALYVPITFDIGIKAINASRRFGKVVAHEAALNLGDCYSYGCARALSVPLLYKGQDFTLTDLG